MTNDTSTFSTDVTQAAPLATMRAVLARSLCASDRCREHRGGDSPCPVPGASADEGLRDL